MSKKASKANKSAEKKYVSIFARDCNRVRKKFHKNNKHAKTISSESSDNQDDMKDNSPTPFKRIQTERRSATGKSELASGEPNVFVLDRQKDTA